MWRNEGESMLISAATQVHAVIGSPIGHSLSPVMMNAAFAAQGLDRVYVAFAVAPHALGAFIQGMRASGLAGVNVTIPHKQAVMQYLDDIDESARLSGAVNTIVVRSGQLIGYNTDGIGYVRSLVEETGIALSSRSILLVGAGGAARGLLYALLQQGARAVALAARRPGEAALLVQEMHAHSGAAALSSVDLLDGEAMRSAVQSADLIINTTPVGMHPHVGVMPLEAEWLAARAQSERGRVIISDILYNPLETKLLKIARLLGYQTHSGVGMFIHQGAYAFEYWTGEPAPLAVMRRTVMQQLQPGVTE
jgi:shikimate dehydrogenase